MVHTIHQQRSRVIDADRLKFGNRQPPGQAAMSSGHLAEGVRMELLTCECADAKDTTVSAWGYQHTTATRLADQESSAPVAHFTATFNSRERVALSLLTAASGWPALLDARRALVVLWLGGFGCII